MPPPETYKSEIGSSLRCARSRPVYTSHYSHLEKPNIPLATQARKTTTYILHVVSITTHTHDRHKSIGGKETKKRKEDKGKERKEKKNETKRKRQAKRRKRQEKQEKIKQESKERRRGKKRIIRGTRYQVYFSRQVKWDFRFQMDVPHIMSYL